jgi:hypothetical protein
MLFTTWRPDCRKNSVCFFSDGFDFPCEAQIDQRILIADVLQPLFEDSLRDALPGFARLAPVVLFEDACSELVDTWQIPLTQ